MVPGLLGSQIKVLQCTEHMNSNATAQKPKKKVQRGSESAISARTPIMYCPVRLVKHWCDSNRPTMSCNDCQTCQATGLDKLIFPVWCNVIDQSKRRKLLIFFIEFIGAAQCLYRIVCSEQMAIDDLMRIKNIAFKWEDLVEGSTTGNNWSDSDKSTD